MIENRRMKAWKAIANLFLDSDLDEKEINDIAKILKETGYTKKELYEIYADEVAVKLWSNLYSVAGEWGCWPDEIFREFKKSEMKGYKKIPFLLNLRRWFVTRMTIQDWKRVEKRLSE